MSRWKTVLLVFAVVALGVVNVALGVRFRRLEREVNRLQGRMEGLESLQSRRAEEARVEMERIQDQVARVELSAAARSTLAVPTIPAPGGGPPTAPAEEVGRIVEEKVEEKIRALREERAALGGERKKSLHDIARELGLEPARQPRVAEIANTAKREIFELLKAPRPDGTSLADDLVDAFLAGDAVRVQQAFLKVLGEKVPGMEITYLEGTVRIQEKAWQGLEQAMGPELCARFRHMNVTPENIETGYDPWVDYLRQRPPR